MAASTAASSGAVPMTVLVTGGSGLVGKAVQAFVEGAGSKDVGEAETWYFAGSKDGDLRLALGWLVAIAPCERFVSGRQEHWSSAARSLAAGSQ